MVNVLVFFFEVGIISLAELNLSGLNQVTSSVYITMKDYTKLSTTSFSS